MGDRDSKITISKKRLDRVRKSCRRDAVKHRDFRTKVHDDRKAEESRKCRGTIDVNDFEEEDGDYYHDFTRPFWDDYD